MVIYVDSSEKIELLNLSPLVCGALRHQEMGVTVPKVVVTSSNQTQLIAKMPGMSRVYYSNSGSEANEKGYKIVRQIAAMKNGGKKHKILYRDRDYHGTTITALSSCGQNERKDQYGPFTPGFVEVPHCCEYRSQFPDESEYGVKIAREIENIILREDPDTVGSIVLEPVTAGGGVITLHEDR